MVIWLKFGLAGIVLASIFSGYKIIGNIIEDNANLVANNIVLERSNSALTLLGIENTRNIVKATNNIITLNSKLKLLTQMNSKLEEVLSKHDLTYLAKKKPGLITNRINAASDRVLKDLSAASINN